MDTRDLNTVESEMTGLVKDMKTMLDDVGKMDFSPELFGDILEEMKSLPEMLEKTVKDAKTVSDRTKGKQLPRKKILRSQMNQQ